MFPKCLEWKKKNLKHWGQKSRETLCHFKKRPWILGFIWSEDPNSSRSLPGFATKGFNAAFQKSVPNLNPILPLENPFPHPAGWPPVFHWIPNIGMDHCSKVCLSFFQLKALVLETSSLVLCFWKKKFESNPPQVVAIAIPKQIELCSWQMDPPELILSSWKTCT